MELKYAVVSSDSNPTYLDFWPYVAKAWKRIGIEPVLLYIDHSAPHESLSEHGQVIFLQSIPEWSIVQQAQCIRFWAARLLDAPFIISDMDMLPISGEYYKSGAAKLSGNGIVSYSSDIIKYRWYKTNPQYPMCYLAGDPESFTQVLELNQPDHKQFLKKLMNMNLRSGTDQKFFYNQALVNKSVTIKHLERGWIEEKYAYRRLDKATWPTSDYNISEYIDCHLPRPLNAYLANCETLFKKLSLC
jgi:hypothetical protein